MTQDLKVSARGLYASIYENCMLISKKLCFIINLKEIKEAFENHHKLKVG